MPAGPAPMMPTLLPLSGSCSGRYIASLPRVGSTAKRLRLQMATGASRLLRRHAPSQGRGHTRPSEPGIGMLCLMSASADSKSSFLR